MEHVEKLRPHSISGPGPEDGAAASQAQFLPTLISVWSEQLRRQWADTPQHSGSGSKRLPASETEEQLRASLWAFPEKVEINDCSLSGCVRGRVRGPWKP